MEEEEAAELAQITTAVRDLVMLEHVVDLGGPEESREAAMVEALAAVLVADLIISIEDHHKTVVPATTHTTIAASLVFIIFSNLHLPLLVKEGREIHLSF